MPEIQQLGQNQKKKYVNFQDNMNLKDESNVDIIEDDEEGQDHYYQQFNIAPEAIMQP